MNDPTTTPQWRPGFFSGNSTAPTQNLAELELSEPERKILIELQSTYKRYRSYADSSIASNVEYSKGLLFELRGLKRALDIIQTTDAGYKQQLEWQTLLY